MGSNFLASPSYVAGVRPSTASHSNRADAQLPDTRVPHIPAFPRVTAQTVLWALGTAREGAEGHVVLGGVWGAVGQGSPGSCWVGQLHAGMKGELGLGMGGELGLLSPHTAGPGGFLEPFERRGQRGSPGRRMGALGRG